MWREIDENQPSAGFQGPRGFSDYIARRISVMQNLMDRDRVKSAARNGELIHVTKPDLTISETGLFKIGARYCEHFPG